LLKPPNLTPLAGEAHTISVVVVTFRQGEEVRPALEALSAQLELGDELIVVDNASGDATAETAALAAPDARHIPSATNEGFPAACNRGALRSTGDILVFLNPDAVPAPGWREAITAPATDGSGWSAWQALVTAEGGRIVNTRGGVVHFTGIAWAGGAGEPVGNMAHLPRPGFVSGACLAIKRGEFERLGGFAPEFFLYHEDVDLSLRMRLAGLEIGVAPDARVDHNYEFDKGPAKWRYLERNRWATIIRVYPAALLTLLMPALAMTELALVVVAALGGWLPQKIVAWGDVLRSLPRLLRERREIQSTARITAGDFAATLTPALDSRYLGRAGRSTVLAGLLAAYWRLVLRALGGPA
jgi:N-acetylglucosaminyl-diphospho-decaprenol L-rhamnosyltransferase